MSLDAPDWQRIVTAVEVMGTVPDAPDWERIIVGPSGGPINITGSPSLLSLYATAGYIGVPVNPLGAQNGQSQNTGQLYLEAFNALFSGPVHSVSLAVRTGQTLTANENFVGIYDFGQTTANTFTLLAGSAAGAADSIWKNSGTVPVPLTTNPVLTVGQTYVVATLCNGNIMNSYGPGQSSAGVANPLPSTFPWFTQTGAGHTTLPATITFASVSPTLVVSILFIA